MIIYVIFAVLFGWVVFVLCHKLNLDSKVLLGVWLIKVVFIFLISYTFLGKSSLMSVPDEDNYFHDALMFYSLAKEEPIYYLKILMDVEPENVVIYNRYFTTTNAWFKMPEFFYNDNRWVVKVHSLFVFFSNGEISVHRLFSGFMALISSLWLFVYFKDLGEKLSGIQLKNNFNQKFSFVLGLSQLFPSYFFYTSFILKESLLCLLIVLLLVFIKKLFVEKIKWSVLLIVILLMVVSVTFRPAFTLSVIYFSGLFWIVIRFINKYQSLIYVVLCLTLILLMAFIFQMIFHKNLIELIQHRQERFLDASKGGIFLVNEKKFVRVPYDWNNVKIDSVGSIAVVRIKKDVPLMYWYLVNFKDTIMEVNQDSLEEYKLVYFIEKANRTVDISTININASLIKNIKSVLEALDVFFFYPRDIRGVLDIIVWIENFLLIILFVLTSYIFIKSKNYLLWVYLLFWLGSIILIISITSPNTGAIIRYRFFILPMLFIIFAIHYLTKEIKDECKS